MNRTYSPVDHAGALSSIAHRNVDAAQLPLTWQTVVLMLGSTVPCLLFAGVLITVGNVDPQQGTWCTVVIVLALNGVVLNRRIRATRAGHLRRILATLLDAGRSR
ncbi:hypothetical protein ACWIGW_44060 [Nocardia brasiliensis]